MMNNKKDFCGPVNLGNPSERSILDFAKSIISMTNSKSKITFKPLPQDDPIMRKPDISLAKKVLNWEPRISTEAGIQKTIECSNNSTLWLIWCWQIVINKCSKTKPKFKNKISK